MQFGSDNQVGASLQVLEKLQEANSGFTHGYGDDLWCNRAKEALKELFNCDLKVFFVATGTAANALALSCLACPWETILCHHQAHILHDESSAPEFFSNGARLIPLSNRAGKLKRYHLERFFSTLSHDPPHTPRAAALSITQANEAGLIYTSEQITSLCSCAHDHDVLVHMDGARFANSISALGCSPADVTWKSGVDVLSLGATKCGALAAEAVIFFPPDLAATFTHRRKRSGHLISKGRLFGAQFVGWLQDNHWLELAGHANIQARRLAEHLSVSSVVSLQWPCEANELFITIPMELADSLRQAGAEFYEWPTYALPEETILASDETFVRLVTSFMTTDDHIAQFCNLIAAYEQTTKIP